MAILKKIIGGAGGGDNIDIISADQSITVQKTTSQGIDTYNIEVAEVMPSNNVTRITLTEEDLESGTYELDFTDVQGFIIETYNDLPIPSDFIFEATGTIDESTIYSFQFPDGASVLKVIDADGNTLINTSTAFPNGIASGEVINAVYESTGEWSVTSDSRLISSDNSIKITPTEDGKGHDITVASPIAIAYASTLQEFNDGVKFLNTQGGGIIYIIGQIPLFDAVNVTNKQFTLTDWVAKDSSETNVSSVLDFGKNLDKIQIIGYSADAAFNPIKTNSGGLFGKFFTLKGVRINIKDLILRGTSPITYSSWNSNCASTQPYLIFTISLLASNVTFRCQAGSSATTTDITMPLRDVAWQDGSLYNQGTQWNAYLSLFNCTYDVAYYIPSPANAPSEIQDSIIIKICGGLPSQQTLNSLNLINPSLNKKIVDYPLSFIIQDYSNINASNPHNFYINCIGCLPLYSKITTYPSEVFYNSSIGATTLVLPSLAELSNPNYILSVDSNGKVYKSAPSGGGSITPSTVENQIFRTVKNSQGELVTAWSNEMLSGFETFPYLDAQQSDIPYTYDTPSAILVRCNPLADTIINDLSVLITQGAEESFRLAIYDHNLNLLGQTAVTSLNQSGLVVLTLPTPVMLDHSESYLIGILTSGNGYLLAGKTVNLQSNNARPYVYQSVNNLTNNTFPNAFESNVLTGNCFIPYIQANGGM